MYIVMTDYKKIPKKYKNDDTKIMLFHEFLDIATGDNGLDIDVTDGILLDISSLNKETYEVLRVYYEYIPMKFYYIKDRHMPDFFIFEEVIIYDDSDCCPIHKIDEESKDILSTIHPLNFHTFVIRDDNHKYETVSNDILEYLKTQECIFDVLTEVSGKYSEYGFNSKNVKEIAKALQDYHKEMMNRYKTFEAFKVNHYTKVPGFIPKIIIIQNLTDLLQTIDYKSIDSIKQAVGSILRLGSAAGIILYINDNSTNSVLDTITDGVNIYTIDYRNKTMYVDKESANIFKETYKTISDMHLLDNHSYILICDNRLDNNILNFLTLNECTCEILSETTNSIKDIAKIIEAYYNEMMHRYHTMEKQIVDHYTKVQGLKQKVLIIKNLHDLLLCPDYKSYDIIRRCLREILRLGKIAGMLVIIQDKEESNIVKELLDATEYNQINLLTVKEDLDEFIIGETV